MNYLRIVVPLITVLNLSALAGETKLSALSFMYYSYANTEDNEFGINRTYLTYTKTSNKSLSYKFQVDIGAGEVSSYSVYLKNAKLDWKTNLGKLTFGLQGMNLFAIQEKNWTYRFIEKSAMDRKKYSASADLGFGWSNKFGHLNASMIISNGAGYKKSENDGYKKLSSSFHIGQAKLKLGYNAGLVLSHENMDYGASSIGKSIVAGGFAGLSTKKIRMGAEFNTHMIKMDDEVTSRLISAYSTLKVSRRVDVFARMDYFDKNIDTALDSETYVITGMNLVPEKALFLAPNVRVSIPESGESDMSYHINLQLKF